MSSTQGAKPDIDRYLVIHVATTCDEHGVYVTKDSAEVIEIGWLLLDAKNCEEVGHIHILDSSNQPGSRNIKDPSRECPCQACQHSYYSTLQ